MKKILFLIPTLSHGGAERVLTNLVNHMDKDKFDITVQTLFDVGIYRSQLHPKVRYLPGCKWYFPGNSHVLKLLSPKQLYRRYVKENYDVVVSYLEGPTARIVAGCPNEDTRLVCFIHVEQSTMKRAAAAFRSQKEARKCYSRFHGVACVADTVRQDFEKLLSVPAKVIYNTVETDRIRALMDEPVPEGSFSEGEIHICSVGRFMPEKGFDRLVRIHRRLLDAGVKCRMHLIGDGKLGKELELMVKEYGLEEHWIFHGFQKNPYKFVAKADLFVCSSHREGFSTAVTEALVVGTPVVSTNCSGAKELLGAGNEFGIVTENDEQALYEGIYSMLTTPNQLKHYKAQSARRGQQFSMEETVQCAEKFLEEV